MVTTVETNRLNL